VKGGIQFHFSSHFLFRISTTQPTMLLNSIPSSNIYGAIPLHWPKYHFSFSPLRPSMKTGKCNYEIQLWKQENAHFFFRSNVQHDYLSNCYKIIIFQTLVVSIHTRLWPSPCWFDDPRKIRRMSSFIPLFHRIILATSTKQLNLDSLIILFETVSECI
jgi:hypothetical protein